MVQKAGQYLTPLVGPFINADLHDVSIKFVRTGYKRPDQNGIYERFIGILCRELLDHTPPHIREIAVKPLLLSEDSLQSQPILGGLYHSYEIKAA